MTRRLLLFTLLALVSGCLDIGDSDPHPEASDDFVVDFLVEYDGNLRGDDNDLYARHAFPTGEMMAWFELSGDTPRDRYEYEKDYSCHAHTPEWEGNWWFEVSLYEEKDGQIISRERWPIDCLEYWVRIDEAGQMELHEGNPPRDKPRDSPGLEVWVPLLGLGLSLVVWQARRRN